MRIHDVVPRMRALAFPITMSLLLLAGAAPVQAETQFGIAGFVGYNTYGMEDANEVIDEVNDALVGTGYSLDEINSGIAFGGGLRIRPSSQVMIALDYERLSADTELSIFDFGFKLDVPANAFTATAVYLFPSTSRARFGIGAGLGYYNSSGSLRADSSGVGGEIDVEGSGVGFHGVGSLDFAISPVVHLEGMAGYRLAETSDVEVGGETAFNAEGEEATLDWSGFMSRVGLTFYFGSGTPSP
jgi:hypothetical protein